MKTYLASTPLLSSSKLGEELYLYLAVSPYVVSSALIREEGKIQKLVYYTSKVLRGAEGQYPPMEKLAFSLVTVVRKLRPYFQVHLINVLTDHPLKKAMNKLEAVKRLIQWAVELNKFNVQYKPKEVIKAQVLANFIVEFTPANNQQDGDQGAKQWVVHVDGSSTQHAEGIGIILESLEGDHLEYVVCLQFQAKTASSDKTVGDQVKVQYVPSIDVSKVNQVDGVANWTTPFVSYLKDRVLSEDAEEARKLRIRAAKFVLMDEL